MYPVRSYLYRFLDICGILLLIGLISAVPFHFFMSKGSSLALYRELISSLFVLLLVIKIIESEKFNFQIREEIFFLLLFPILLCFAVFYDPMLQKIAAESSPRRRTSPRSQSQRSRSIWYLSAATSVKLILSPDAELGSEAL